MAKTFEIINMKNLELDAALMVKAAEMSCNSLAHGSYYRYYLTSGGAAGQQWELEKTNQFHLAASTSIDVAMENRGNSMGGVEAPIPTQSKIGCSSLRCDANGFTYSVVCVVGGKGSVSSADFQFVGGSRDGYMSHKLTDYITNLNQNRAAAASNYRISYMSNLVIDNNLEKKAISLDCNMNPGPDYRVFWLPSGDKAGAYVKGVGDKFFQDAMRSSVNQALSNAGSYLGMVESISPSQTKIGCAHKTCKWQGYEFSAICLLGPKNYLSASDLPFGPK